MAVRCKSATYQQPLAYRSSDWWVSRDERALRTSARAEIGRAWLSTRGQFAFGHSIRESATDGHARCDSRSDWIEESHAEGLVPTATTVALLVNPTNPIIAETLSRDVQTAARTLGLQLHVLNASTERDFDTAFATLTQLRASALVIGPDSFFNVRKPRGMSDLIPQRGQSGPCIRSLW